MSKFSTTAELFEKTPSQIFYKRKSAAARSWILADSAAPFALAYTVAGTINGARNNSDCCEKWKQLRVSSPKYVFPKTLGAIE